MAGNYRIVIIEDNEDDQFIYERYIRQGLKQDIELIFFDLGEDAIAYLSSHGEIDCILLDYQLPDLTGIEILEKLTTTLSKIPPVVMLTGMGNENIAIQALKLGAYDYLNKSELQGEILIKAISNAAEKSTLAKNVNSKDQKINKMVNCDLLTGLPNRTKFNELLTTYIDGHKGPYIAVYMLDLDRFKDINDTMGHDYGDQVLRSVANLLQKKLPFEMLLARFGGDEFAALMMLNTPEEADEHARKIIQIFSKPISIEGNQQVITASIGVAVYPHAGETAIELLKNADTALFKAKEAGKNTYKFFSSTMSEILSERTQIETGLRSAIDNEELHLVYHPICQNDSQEIYALEVLLRWHSQDLGVVSPDKFIPIAEETQLIYEIGEWILDTAFEQLAAWQQQFTQKLMITINISPIQTRQLNWLNIFQQKLREHNIDPKTIIIELTETAIISDLAHTNEVLSHLSKLGCLIFLDDFGTGYSSLNLVRQFPISGLKIDKSYAEDLLKTRDAATLVKSIIAFASVLDLSVVAEGIEQQGQLDYLKQISSQQFSQGFFFTEPLNAKAMEVFLSKQFPKK